MLNGIVDIVERFGDIVAFGDDPSEEKRYQLLMYFIFLYENPFISGNSAVKSALNCFKNPLPHLAVF